MTWTDITKDLLMILAGGGGVTIIRLFFEKRKAKAEAKSVEVDVQERERKSVLEAYDNLEDAFYSQHEKIMELSAKLLQAQLMMNELQARIIKDPNGFDISND